MTSNLFPFSLLGGVDLGPDLSPGPYTHEKIGSTRGIVEFHHHRDDKGKTNTEDLSPNRYQPPIESVVKGPLRTFLGQEDGSSVRRSPQDRVRGHGMYLRIVPGYVFDRG